MSGQADRFHRGERLGATKLNRVVELANRTAREPAGVLGYLGFGAQAVLPLEIVELNPAAAAGVVRCVLPGESGNPSAQEWTVELPPIYTEASRGPVTYTYSDVNTRLASDGGTNPDEDQFLTPPLTVGEVIQVRDEYGAAWRMLGDGRMWAVDP